MNQRKLYIFRTVYIEVAPNQPIKLYITSNCDQSIAIAKLQGQYEIFMNEGVYTARSAKALSQAIEVAIELIALKLIDELYAPDPNIQNLILVKDKAA